MTGASPETKRPASIMDRLSSIMDIPMVCMTCGSTCQLGDCVPCVDPDGGDGTGFGCPVEDCGGIMTEFAR